MSKKDVPRAGTTVDEYIAKQKPALQEIAKNLRNLVKKAAPELREEMKWFPCYVGTDKHLQHHGHRKMGRPRLLQGRRPERHKGLA